MSKLQIVSAMAFAGALLNGGLAIMALVWFKQPAEALAWSSASVWALSTHIWTHDSVKR